MSATPDTVLATSFAGKRLAKPVLPPEDPRRSPGVCAIRGTVTAAPGICSPAGIPGATYRLSAVTR